MTALRLEVMRESDLDWVVAQEQQLHPFPWSRGNFADSLGAGYLAYVLFKDDEPAAYAVMMTVLDEAHLLNISVAPAQQKQGLGRELLARLSQCARERGAQQLYLEVRPSNTVARHLYQKAGFVEVGRRKRYYPAAGGGREDAVVMRAVL